MQTAPCGLATMADKADQQFFIHESARVDAHLWAKKKPGVRRPPAFRVSELDAPAEGNHVLFRERRQQASLKLQLGNGGHLAQVIQIQGDQALGVRLLDQLAVGDRQIVLTGLGSLAALEHGVFRPLDQIGAGGGGIAPGVGDEPLGVALLLPNLRTGGKGTDLILIRVLEADLHLRRRNGGVERLPNDGAGAERTPLDQQRFLVVEALSLDGGGNETNGGELGGVGGGHALLKKEFRMYYGILFSTIVYWWLYCY